MYNMNVTQLNENFELKCECFTYIISSKQLCLLFNEYKQWKVHPSFSVYPFYWDSGNKINLFEFLFGYKYDNEIIFKDDNKNNLTETNITSKHHFILNDYKVLDSSKGTLCLSGRYSGKYKNPYWKVKSTNNEILYLMFCEPNIYIKLCEKGFNIIKKYEKSNDKNIIWYSLTNGSIAGKINKKQLCLHRFLLGIDNDKEIIEHINNDHSDNRLSNLKYSNMKTINTKKSSVIKKDCGLVLPKYVEYYQEIINNDNNNYREFFKIKKNNNLLKSWKTSKSTDISLGEKYKKTILKYKTIFPNYEDNQYTIKKININYNELTFFNNDIKYIIDDKQALILKNENEVWFYSNHFAEHFYYINTNEKQLLSKLIINNKQNLEHYIFKNKNKYDYRQKNIDFVDDNISNIKLDYDEIIEYINGHKYGTVEKNPMWKVKNDGEIFYVMFCGVSSTGQNIFTKLCETSLQKIKDFEYKIHKKLTFHNMANGYIGTHVSDKYFCIHQIIMNHYGNGRGTMITSIDHINRDPLDNRYNNLKIATRKEQETNKTRTGRIRSKMPEGFIEENFPKYVEYCTEKLPSGLMRESFRISKTGTPLEKHWYTSKSVKISIKDKYDKMIEKYKSVFGDELLKDVILYK